MGRVIGIDLGTTNSCVAVMEGGSPVILPNAEGQRLTPSVVALTKTGQYLVGDVAKRQAAVNPAGTVRSVKRSMGSTEKLPLLGEKYLPQEISAMILRKLKTDAESYLGEAVTDAVITVPAYFTDSQRQATKDAGKIAGLNVLRILNEPTAAALAYGVDKEEPQKVLVFDLGGGTFDVSVLEISGGVIEVLATAGNNRLGGDDFDQCVVDWLLAEIRRLHRIDLSRDGGAMQRIREAAEKAKIELSSLTETTVSLPYLTAGKTGPIHLETILTRARFNELTAHLVKATEGPVRQAVTDAGVSMDQLGKVLMVGGSSRIPAVQESIGRILGKSPFQGINPDECVAMGACLQSGVLSGAVKGLLLLDVMPISMGIETLGGVYAKIIDRNTAIPIQKSRIFTTAANFQSSVDIHVLQGEAEMARDNRELGQFQLTGIRRALRGVPQIEVTFSVDANGIVSVSAKDLDTGRAQSITVTATSNMSRNDIDRAIRRTQKENR